MVYVALEQFLKKDFDVFLMEKENSKQIILIFCNAYILQYVDQKVNCITVMPLTELYL